MAQVTYTKLFSESRTNVVSLISDFSNVADPITSSSEFRKWIYSREPDVKSADFGGYPFIIIHPADVDIDSENGTLDGKSKRTVWDIEIEIDNRCEQCLQCGYIHYLPSKVEVHRHIGNKEKMGLLNLPSKYFQR